MKTVRWWVGAGTAALAATGWAAGTNTNPTAQTIVVTATRVAMPVKDVASSVTVIDSAQMEERQNGTVVEALRAVPGLDIVQSGGKGGTVSTYIRGANSDQILVLVDGVEINEPSSPGREVDLSQIPVENIDRIEVLRGPQSTLYGADAIGGVVNIVTKQGEGPATVSATAEAGSYQTFNERLEAQGGTKQVNYSLGASRQDSQGFSTASEKNGNTEKDGYDRTELSGQLGWTPSDAVGLKAIVRWEHANYDYDDFLNGRPVDADNEGLTDRLLFRGEGSLKLFDDRWQQKLGVSLAEHHREDHTAAADSSFDSSLRKADWQNDVQLGDHHLVTAGLEYQEESAETVYEAPGLVDRFDRKTARDTAVFAQDLVKAGDLSAAIGGRVDDQSAFGSETTWRVAPLYELAGGTRLKGSVGTGYKAPSLFQLYSVYGSPELQPEKSLGWDAGVEQDLADKRVTVGATWFDNRYSDLINYDYASSHYGNIGKAESHGVETFAQAKPVDDLTLRATYTYTGTRDITTGEELLRRPRDKAAFEATYKFTPKARGTVSLLYVGDRKDEDFATYQTVTLDSYTLLNFYAAYDLRPNVTLFGRLENALDADYEEVLGYGTAGRSVYGGVKVTF